jgi:hypothetical protein
MGFLVDPDDKLVFVPDSTELVFNHRDLVAVKSGADAIGEGDGYGTVGNGKTKKRSLVQAGFATRRRGRTQLRSASSHSRRAPDPIF